MIVVAGLPGSGKTTLGVQIAQKIACADNDVGLIVSMEMTKQELVTRGIASVGRAGTSPTEAYESWARAVSIQERKNKSPDKPLQVWSRAL